MSDPAPATPFKSVQYSDPFGAPPLGVQACGIQAVLDPGPQGTVAYARLLSGDVPLGGVVRGSAVGVSIVNAAPLLPNQAYVLQVQFAASPPTSWTGAAVFQSPVVAQLLRITAITVSATGLTFSWETPAGAAIANARLQIIKRAGDQLSILVSALAQTQTAFVPFTFVAGTDYLIRITGLQSIVGSKSGNAAPPFSLGPSPALQPIPAAAPAITAVTIGDGSIAAQWTSPAVPADAPVPVYEILLLDGGAIVAVATAGAAGGQIALAGGAALAQPQVAARMRYGTFIGPTGSATPLYLLAPVITNVQVNAGAGAKMSVQAASPGPLPTGGTMMATLYANGVPLTRVALTGGQATFVVNPIVAGTVYSIDTMVAVAGGGITSFGPRSPRVTVPVAAPQVTSADYDGKLLAIGLVFDTPVPPDGYQVELFGTSTPVFRTGSALPITIPANLDLSSNYKLSVTPILGVVQGIPSPSSTVLNQPAIAAPGIVAVEYDGITLAVRWSAATLPFLSGYSVAVSGGPTIVTGAGETSCAVPLASVTAGATVTVTGLSPLRSTAASAAVAIPAKPIPVASLSVDPATGVATARWASGAGAASYLVRIVQDGGRSDLTVPTGTTSYSFTPPAGAVVAISVAGVTVAGGARATGPFGPPVAIPRAAPALTATDFDGTTASFAWTPVPGASGYRASVFRAGTAEPVAQFAGLPATPASASTKFTPPAADGSYTIVVQALFGPLDGPASTPAPLLAAPVTLAPATFDGSTIAIAATPPSGPAPTAYAVTLARNGAPFQMSVASTAAIGLAVAGAIDADDTYALAVRPLLGIATGPAAVAPVTVASPPVTAIAWNTAIQVTTALATGWTGAARLIVDGVPQAPVPLDGKGSVSLTPPATGKIGVAVQGSLGGAAGPWSAPIALSRATADGLVLRLDGTTLTAAWASVMGADGYAVTATVNGTAQPAVITHATAATLTLPAGTTTATVAIAAIAGVVTGPASVPSTAIVEPCALAKLDYANGILSASWTSASASATTRLAALAGETIVAEADFGGKTGTLRVVPSIDGVVLREVSTAAIGPASAAVTPVTTAPRIASAAFDPATGDCTVTWPPVSGATGYDLLVNAPGAEPIAVPAGATPVTCVIPAAKLPSGAFAVTCRGSANTASLTVTGPWSEPVGLPAAIPAITTLALEPAGLFAQWTPVAGATGYVVTLAINGAPAQATTVFQDHATLAVPQGATRIGVTVAAMVGDVVGRASPATAALTDVPALTRIGCDDGVLTLAWDKLASASGYRVAFVSGTTVIDQADFTTAPATLPARSGSYGIVLRALARTVSTAAIGPASAAVAPVTAAPRIASAAFDPATGDCTVTWPPVAGATGYDLLVNAPGAEPITVPAGATPVTCVIPAAKLPAGAFAVTCRGSANTASLTVTGPWSDPVALPAAIPAITALALEPAGLIAQWTPVAGATGYVVTLAINGAPAQATTVFQDHATLAVPQGATRIGVTVAAMVGDVVGRASPATAALADVPALTHIGCDDGVLTLAWDKLASASGYRVAFVSGTTVIDQADFTAAPATLPARSGSYGIVLRALAGTAIGPATAAIVPITTAPVIASATFDSITGGCTLAWPAIAGATSYIVRLMQPGHAPVDATVQPSGTAITYTIPPASLAGGGPFSVLVQGLAAPAVAGPWSAPAALPSLAPEVVRTRYDGTVLHAGWRAVGGADGYRLSLASGGQGTLLGDVAGTDATIQLAATPAADAALVVQAIGPLGAGPPSIGRALVEQGWFLTGQAPWALAPLAGPAAAPEDVALQLPDLFDGAKPAVMITPRTFAFDAGGGGYQLTILGSGPAWRWDAASRAQVQSDYGTLIAALEAAHWTPQARALTLDAIARALPQTFDETNYYACGFEPAQGWFDLRPGMTLHVEYEAYQYPGPNADPVQAADLDGFVAAAAVDYPITAAGSGAGWFVTFDAALAQMAANHGIQVTTMAPTGDFSPGGGGLIDAFFDQFRQPLCRVVYPTEIIGQTSQGNSRLAANPVLLAAASIADLQAAAQAVRNASMLPTTVGAFYFRGRATLSPRITVTLDGTPLSVAVGTTLGDVIAAHGVLAAGLTIRRGTGAAGLLPKLRRALDIRVDWTPGQAGRYGLPLMAGDAIETGR